MMESRLLHQYDELVALAYTGIREAKPWQSFVEGLADIAEVQQASLLITSVIASGQPTIVTSEQAPDLTTAEYFQRVLATDTMRFINTLTVAQPQTLDEMLTPPRWLSSELYRNFLQPRHINQSLLVDVWRDPLMLIRLGVERTDAQGAFSAEERSLVARLVRHLAKSIGLFGDLQTLDASSNFYREVMDRLGIGTFFLNHKGELIEANRTGHILLTQRLGLQLRKGKLTVIGSAAFQVLLNGVLQADTPPLPQGIRLFDEHGAALLEIVGRRLPRPVAPDTQTSVAVLLTLPCGPASGHPTSHLLQDMYDFTVRENDLALALAQGYTTQQVAESLGISVNTVKTHLRGIFEKTGCRNQSQLVRRLNNSVLRLL
jgi:DNA-binding CsgD family transcriptional regulator